MVRTMYPGPRTDREADIEQVAQTIVYNWPGDPDLEEWAEDVNDGDVGWSYDVCYPHNPYSPGWFIRVEGACLDEEALVAAVQRAREIMEEVSSIR